MCLYHFKLKLLGIANVEDLCTNGLSYCLILLSKKQSSIICEYVASLKNHRSLTWITLLPMNPYTQIIEKH